MGYLRALSYIGYVTRILGALGMFQASRNEVQLADELLGVVTEAVYPYTGGNINLGRVREGVRMVISGLFPN